MGVEARIDYEDLGFLLGRHHIEDVKDNSLHSLLKELTSQAEPTFEDEYDKKWQDFYLPVERDGEVITVPFNVEEYLDPSNNNFTLGFPSHMSLLCVRKEPEEWSKYDRQDKCRRMAESWKPVFNEAMSFIPTLKEKGEDALNVPFDIRLGKVKGKHVLEETISEEERKKISEKYERRVSRDISGISLNGYFKTAAICYKAAFPERTEGLTTVQMYNKFSHSSRGVFPLNDPNDEEEFANWLRNDRPGHAFWFAFRVAHLYPPNDSKPFYRLANSEFRRGDDIEQAQAYLGMVKALIDAQIPFEAYLDDALDYLTGKTEFSVNLGEYPIFHYDDTPENREEVLPHIKWNPLKLPNFK